MPWQDGKLACKHAVTCRDKTANFLVTSAGASVLVLLFSDKCGAGDHGILALQDHGS